MKKIFTIFLCILISVSLFAQEDVRTMGMGGKHVTDFSDIYTIMKNPASLGFSGKHSLYTNFQLSLNGPLNEYYDLANTIIESTENTEEFDISKVVSDLVLKNNGLYTGANFVGPIQFGFINNGFGLMFSENMYMDATIPSITLANVNVGLQSDLTIAYGRKIDLGLNDIAFGVSATGIAKVIDVGLNGSLTDILSMTSSIPTTTALGYSISAGVHYSFANLINIGLVWNDIYAPTYSIDSPFFEINLDEETEKAEKNTSFENSIVTVKPSSISVGIGIKIPTSFTFGIISSWTAYVDHENILVFFDENNLRNPILGFNAGTELELFKTIRLRLGINESYLSAGVGLKLGVFHVDAAIFGSELGLEPGAKPNLNAALSISFHK